MNFNVTKFYVEILYGKLSIENTTNLSDSFLSKKKERKVPSSNWRPKGGWIRRIFQFDRFDRLTRETALDRYVLGRGEARWTEKGRG